MEYKEWRQNAAEETEERVLKTIDKILDDNEGSSRLHAQELDDLLDCWKIMCHMHPTRPPTNKSLSATSRHKKIPLPARTEEGDFYSLHQAFGAKMFLTY